MTFRDLIDLSAGNLWRKKLRAILTVSGVIIAIATLVAMLSFAAGNHKYVTEGYSELGLLTGSALLGWVAALLPGFGRIMVRSSSSGPPKGSLGSCMIITL